MSQAPSPPPDHREEGVVLWRLIPPFDSSFSVVRFHLFPFLSDFEAVHCSLVNRATFAFFPLLPIRHTFSARPPEAHLGNTHHSIVPYYDRPYVPRITRLVHVSSFHVFHLVPHLTSLDLDERWPPPVDLLRAHAPRTLRQLRLYGGCFRAHHGLGERKNRPYCSFTPGTFPPQLTHLRLSPRQRDEAAGARRPSIRLEPGLLPATLQLLELSWDLDAPLVSGVLPPGLRELEYWACQPLHAGVLPSSLTRLRLVGPQSAPLAVGALPPLLRRLELTGLHGHPTETGVLPPELAELDMGDCHTLSKQGMVALSAGLRLLRMQLRVSEPLLAETFAGCPLLQVLDLSCCGSWTVEEKSAGLVDVAALPAGLKELRLPERVRLTGVVPPGLTVTPHLEMGWE